MLGNPGYKILKFLFAENTVLGFGVRNSALQESGILEMIGIRNPSSADKEFEIRLESKTLLDCFLISSLFFVSGEVYLRT